MSEWTRYYYRPEWHEFEALHARFENHVFSRHSHPYFVVGYIERGVQSYRYRGARHVTPAGQVFLVNADEGHTGESATSSGYVYRTMYPRPELLTDVAHQMTGRWELPFFAEAVVSDPELSARLTAFHRALADPASAMAVEWRLLDALAHLIAHHTSAHSRRRTIADQRPAVRLAREYIDAHCSSNLTLATLAATVGLSAFHLARAFEREVGVPPHVYLECARHRRARSLLDAGLPIADAAVAAGYADQSHFTRRFKRLSGLTPAQYVRARR
jgi:AraC-like DNA-binding protein